MSTIKDIAKAAGVSITTVSRALNGYSDVSIKTKQRIHDIAKELEYSPNALARSLVMKKTKTIGLLVSGLNRSGSKDHIVMDVLTGIHEYCGEYEYDIVLFSTSTSRQGEKTYTQLCRERRVDGVIVQGIKKDDPYLIEILNSDIPCVLVDVPAEGEKVGFVTTDNVEGAMKAIDHLVSLGHDKIAMVNGHDQAFVSQERLKGFKLGLENLEKTFHPRLVVNGDYDEAISEEKAFQLLQHHPEITAVFCASDLMAFGVMRAARRHGLRVPEDLSIVGYDDIALASYVSPPLTTIAQDTFEMGYAAARLLVGILEETEVERICMVDNELKIRETTIKQAKIKK
ncbi:transcriptional regulator, LacI family [Halobacillus alkaliphilus]|uniref:Transcriptional regulator, LacI family n=1 Tax=Halobacillus alkaliphilus TaxID=396056 RepID=A0A1I2KQL5_9BACI|nr:LacI family DNA-binding transcriptional regulator [Halobacillus alkaliphilus]SFF67411.1 transcriptional regulator, LacI family [Halobacillus alkaliphilus]